MCQFKSAICLKDRVYVPDHDHHDDMLSELGIDDDYLHASKTFVRVELSPTDGDKTSDVMGWKLKVDQDITPDWWDESVGAQRIKDAVKEWCDKHILREGTHVVKEGIWYAYDSATVNAYGSATVYAYDSATVYAYGSATVYAYDSATVKAYGSATVNAYDSATVFAYDSATVYAYGSATVYASGSATVILPKIFQTRKPVQLSGSAICINHLTHKISRPFSWEVETV